MACMQPCRQANHTSIRVQSWGHRAPVVVYLLFLRGSEQKECTFLQMRTEALPRATGRTAVSPLERTLGHRNPRTPKQSKEGPSSHTFVSEVSIFYLLGAPGRYLDLQHGQQNGPYTAYTLYFGILDHYFGLSCRSRYWSEVKEMLTSKSARNRFAWSRGASGRG